MKAEVCQVEQGDGGNIKKGDLQGVANFYADDGVLIGPNNFRIAGRKAIDQYWTSLKGAKD